MITEWAYAETDPSDQLARLHYFSMIKEQDGDEVEFTITVREYAPARDHSRRFMAQADKQTNQKTAPFTPVGWGPTLCEALADCVRAVHRFPYDGGGGADT